MPQSLSNIVLHIIFSTKDRQAFITPDLAPKLHAYLATTARNLGGECYRAGGVSDHVHLALQLPRTLTTAKLVETLKSSSSKWAKEQSPQLTDFTWQRGYGAFSVSPSQLMKLTDYIDRQEEHHRQRSFQDEYRSLLKKLKIPYDEKYLWD